MSLLPQSGETMKKQRTSITVQLLILAIILAMDPVGSSALAGGPEKISIGISSPESWVLIAIAESRGLFNKFGIEPVFKRYEQGYPSLLALAKGEIDMAVASEFAFVNGSFQNDELRVLASIATAPGLELIVRKECKIEAPRDFKGKRIGFTSNSAGEFCLMMFLASHLISPKDVDLVDLPPRKIADAFSRGDIDAAISEYFYTFEIGKTVGPNAVIWPSGACGDLYWLLIGTKKLVDSRSGLIERFLKALVEAEEFARTHKVEAQAILTSKWKLDQPYLESIWSKYRFAVVLEQSLLLALDSEARWKIKEGTSKRSSIPNYLNFIYLRGLYSVNGRAVSIFR